MADVQPENGTAPIAYALLEALSHDPAVSISGRILIWVLRNTYGRRAQNRGLRRKVCVFSWVKIADDIGASRSDVSRAGRRLLSTKRLVLDAREHIGLQKDYEKWTEWSERAQMPRGKCHGGKSAHERAQMRTLSVRKQQPYKGRARAVVAVQSEPGGSLTRPATETAPSPSSRTTATALLPNGKADTMRNRADLGHEKFSPEEHADWRTADFRRREEMQEQWEAAQRQRESDDRARAAQEVADRIERERAAPDSKTDHREMLRKMWPRKT